MSQLKLGWIGMLLLAITAFTFGRAQAHPASVAGARVKIALDGSFVATARFDILAYVLNKTPVKVEDAPMNALLDGPPANLQAALLKAQTRFATEFVVRADNGVGTIDSVAMPTVAQVNDFIENGIPPRLPVSLPVIIKGHLPPNARTIAFGFPAVLGSVVLTTEIPNQEPYSEPLENGAFSTPQPLIAAPITAPAQHTAPTPPPSAAALLKPRAPVKPTPTSAKKGAAKSGVGAPEKSKKSPPAKPTKKAPDKKNRRCRFARDGCKTWEFRASF